MDSVSCEGVGLGVGVDLSKDEVAVMRQKMASISRAMAVAEFGMDGVLQDVNQVFLDTIGYAREDVLGRHHSMFVMPEERSSGDYMAFWRALAVGQYQSGCYCRVAAGGRPVWLQASYNPVLDDDGRPFKVVKVALDVTAGQRALVEGRAVASRLAVASEGLSVTGASLVAGAEKTLCETERVSTEVANVDREVQSVATSVVELDAGSKQIALSAQEAAAVASQSVALAAEVGAALERLAARSAEIEEVVKVISTVAQQTNLLALNAMIEAARAGDAGRGFAVVAGEVKELANETASSSERIRDMVAAIQGRTEEAVVAAQKVSDIMASIDMMQATVASAVEQQSAATSEISASLAEASSGCSRIGECVASVVSVASDSRGCALETKSAADDLNELAVGLGGLVAKKEGGEGKGLSPVIPGGS